MRFSSPRRRPASMRAGTSVPARGFEYSGAERSPLPHHEHHKEPPRVSQILPITSTGGHPRNLEPTHHPLMLAVLRNDKREGPHVAGPPGSRSFRVLPQRLMRRQTLVSPPSSSRVPSSGRSPDLSRSLAIPSAPTPPRCSPPRRGTSPSTALDP